MMNKAQNNARTAFPQYVGIVQVIEADILSGRLAPGQKLPPIRQLAKQFTVGPNTVQRAAAELKRMGLIVSKRGFGLLVTADTSLINRCRQAQARRLADKLGAYLNALGFSSTDILKML